MTRNPVQAIGCLFLLTLLVGCRGCTPAPSTPTQQGPSSSNDRDLETDDLRSLPYAKDTVGVFLKPGHWYQANQKLTARRQDEDLVSSVMIYDRERKPVPMFPGYSPVNFQRDLTLATGQSKNIRMQFFQPDVPVTNTGEFDSSAAASHVTVHYTSRANGASLFVDEYPTRLMQGYQYNIITLNTDPSRYIFWRGLPSFHWPSTTRLPSERISPHRVYDLAEEEIAGQFPSRLYAMTSTSHIVINDTSPARFSNEQQEAFLDWLHFGGTVIINGPDAVAGVDSSFFRAYAPLRNTTTVDWSSKETKLLNDHWTISQLRGEIVPFVQDPSLTMLVGDLVSDASWIPSLEGLVAERLVGQGRIVMTTFPMSSGPFLRWPSYDSFIHNAILRKPRRTILSSSAPDLVFAPPYTGTELNPIHSTRMRIWARDLDATMANATRRPLPSSPTSGQDKAPLLRTKLTSLGAWTTNSEVLRSARESLQETAGITVPRIQTIISLLAGYLVVLVPVNWLVFRLLGRVELAWVAAPIIAIVGAVVVARSVQLDVGFSRSQNSYAFLECHPNYSRGIHSGYHALYTSLSTTYRATYDDDQGIVSPMATPREQSLHAKRFLPQMARYTYANAMDNGLQNNSVLSNTTGMLRSEEIAELGGTYRMSFDREAFELKGAYRLEFPIYDVGVLGRDGEGKLHTGWLGTVEPDESIQVSLRERVDGVRWFDTWETNPLLRSPSIVREDGSKWGGHEEGEKLYLGAMLETVAMSYPLEVGEFIAIGWTDTNLSRLSIAPSASQTKASTLVLLHLTPPSLSNTVRPDTQIFPKIEEEELSFEL